MGLSNLPNPCFGPDELDLCLGLLRMDVGLTRSPSCLLGWWMDIWSIYLSLSLFKIHDNIIETIMYYNNKICMNNKKMIKSNVLNHINITRNQIFEICGMNFN